MISSIVSITLNTKHSVTVKFDSGGVQDFPTFQEFARAMIVKLEKRDILLTKAHEVLQRYMTHGDDGESYNNDDVIEIVNRIAVDLGIK